MPFKLSRREFLKLIGEIGILSGAVFFLGDYIRKIVLPKPDYFRPPGALEERDFLSTCIRCQLCVEACPTGLINPVKILDVLDIAYTPTLALATNGLTDEGVEEEPLNGICVGVGDHRKPPNSRYEGIEYTQCERQCQRVCPTPSLQKIAADHPGMKIATLKINPDRCVASTTGCDLWCFQVCPVVRQGKPAIVSIDGVITINNDECVGCGMCIVECRENVMEGIIEIVPQAKRINLWG